MAPVMVCGPHNRVGRNLGPHPRPVAIPRAVVRLVPVRASLDVAVASLEKSP